MHRCSWVAAACGALVSSAGMAQAVWSPDLEPMQWRQQRESLVTQHPRLADDWQFMEADRTDSREVAEYLRGRERASSNHVRFEALLLLRRGTDPWVVRTVQMRAVCDAGRLERVSSDQQWTAYPARPGTVERVAWICSEL